MLWRLRFSKRTSFLPNKAPSFAALHSLSPPIHNPVYTKPQESPFTEFSSKKGLNRHLKNPIFLTPQVVQTTLQNCPSDIIALCFFLWCARQPDYFHDKATFQYMVSIVSNLTRKNGSVKALIHELEALGCVTKAQTLLLLMRIYCFGAMYDLVLEAFEEMGSYGYVPNTYAWNIVMDVLFKVGLVDMALRVLNEIPVPNFLSFNIAVCNLCRLNGVDNVKVVLKSMFSKGYHLNEHTYSLVLNCFCKSDKMGEALQLLGLMIVYGVPISVKIWSRLIDGFSKSRRIDIAANLLEKMIESGCSPNIVTCTSIVKGLMESRNSGKAFEILEALESNGCFPDLVLCNVLIDCFSKMGRYYDAFEVFSSLRERKLLPDVYTYTSLISNVCLSRKYFLLPLLISGYAIDPDLAVCNSLLSYFCKAGHPTGAVEFYNDMIDRGFEPDKYTFAGLLSALCRSGRILEAENVYNGIIQSTHHHGLDAHIHTIIIKGLIESGRFYKATRLFKKVVAENLAIDVVSCNVAINGFIRAGEKSEAYELFRQMEEMGIDPNPRTYNLLLRCSCRDMDEDMVKYLLKEMVVRNVKLEEGTYRLMENVLGKSRSRYELFVHLRDSGLLPDEARASLMDGRGFCGLVLNASSSEDLPDVAVSVG